MDKIIDEMVPADCVCVQEYNNGEQRIWYEFSKEELISLVNSIMWSKDKEIDILRSQLFIAKAQNELLEGIHA